MPKRRVLRSSRLGPHLWLLVGSLAVLSAGCGGSTTSDTGTGCGVPGSTQTCQGNCDYGTQTCQITGEWTDCLCSDGNSAASGGSTGGTNAGSSGGNGTGAGAGSGAGTGASSTADAGVALDASADAALASDASSTLDGANADAAPSGPQIYDRCMRSDDCPKGASCHRNGLGGANGVGSGFCTVKCDTKDDCPAPADGNALANCSDSSGSGSSTCQLVCGAAVTCPTGLVCVNLGPAGLCL